MRLDDREFLLKHYCIQNRPRQQLLQTIPNDALQLTHRQVLRNKKLDLVHLRKVLLSAVLLDDKLYNA